MKPWVLILVLFTFLSAKSNDAVKALLDKAMAAQKKYQETTAIDIYKQALKIDSINFTALYNIAYLYQRQGWMEEGINNEKAKTLYTTFKKYADVLYRHYPNTFEANVVRAGAFARMARYQPAKERVLAAWEIKKYGEIAYKLNPTHPDVLHMLAWWNYELTKPTWIERKLSDLLFGGLPKGATMDNAFSFLKKAMQVKPNYIVFFYDMAVFFIHTGDELKAIENLKKAISMKANSPEEVQYIGLAKKKLESIE